MNATPSSPDPSPVNSPLSGKAKSLKARWMKTFEEDNTGKELSSPIENNLAMPTMVVNSNPVPPCMNHEADVQNSMAKPAYHTSEPALPNLTKQGAFASVDASTVPLDSLMPNSQENGRGIDVSTRASLGVQYRLAQAQAQLGILPNIVPMSAEQQTQIIKHAINLEQQSQMIKQAMLLYLAQAELARENSLASMPTQNNSENNLCANTDVIQQVCSSSSEVTNKVINSEKQSECTQSELPTSAQLRTSMLQATGVASVPSPPVCQLYPVSTSRAQVPYMASGNVMKTPEPARTLTQERRPSLTAERQPSMSQERRVSENEIDVSINSPVQTACHCSQMPTASTVSKVSKDMGIQTDDLPGVMPVNSPGRSSIDQALQLLQSTQPNDRCRNWLAKHVTGTTDLENHSAVGTTGVVESASISQESINSPLKLLQASVANTAIDTVNSNPSSSPIDMTVQCRKEMVSSTQCTNAGEATSSTSRAPVNFDYTTQRPLDNKCPVCTDEISGYHYGIFSCESCKGFFKRTVQSKRNERLRCGRGDTCVIDIDSRKHCAACRFNKCLNLGMKLEAIRLDRQRGGRSMYEGSSEFRRRQEVQAQQSVKPAKRRRRTSQVKKVKPLPLTPPVIKQEPTDANNVSNPQPSVMAASTSSSSTSILQHQVQGPVATTPTPQGVLELDPLLKELIQAEEQLLDQEGLMGCCRDAFDLKEGDLFSAACHLMDHQLYTFVKWARTLPLYKELKTEDQILLMQRRGLHLMAITLCFYFIDAQNRISLPNGQKVVLGRTEDQEIEDIMQRLVDTAGRFRAVNLDKCQLVCLKGIMLLNPVSQGLIEVKRVQEMQEKMEDLLIDYVASQPQIEDKVTGELLLRLSEVERVCQLIREQVMVRKVEGRLGRYPLLMELFQDKPSWLY